MPGSCAAWGCKNRHTVQTRLRGITFHKFPKEAKLRKQWEIALRRKGFSASEYSLLCSEHFKPEDFDRTGQTVRLRDGTKPSVFSLPTHLQKKVTTRTTQTSRKAEESLSVESLLQSQESKQNQDTLSHVDHNYALPASLAGLKARLDDVLARVESLEREKRNLKDRERRAKNAVRCLLLDLKSNKNILNGKTKK
ncbi:THAP domain-containing protein 6-like [Melanotaenia boesemani]|uniref:THAP domain-containing protein 6-like n=1 Tax=Melanotaenia boesemani TaxID=1250792 RepID=UPI001C0581A5|nr:THAP domain-containing protein 6-like [Melanotaenia boesemani]